MTRVEEMKKKRKETRTQNIHTQEITLLEDIALSLATIADALTGRNEHEE